MLHYRFLSWVNAAIPASHATRKRSNMNYRGNTPGRFTEYLAQVLSARPRWTGMPHGKVLFGRRAHGIAGPEPQQLAREWRRP
jgi:hypothetical protein